ncbi:MAG: hypothetical protein ACYDGR_07935 [Candidatus Dormibacteria bacterium]
MFFTVVAVLTGIWLWRLGIQIATDLAVAGVCIDGTLPNCAKSAATFFGSPGGQLFVDPRPQFLLLGLPILPAVLIVAPATAAEFERGTYEFLWVQVGGGLRWLAGHGIALSAVLLANLAMVCVAASYFEWSKGPFGRDLFLWQSFDVTGFVMIAYGAFAISLALCFAIWTGRGIASMALTVLCFSAIRVFVAWVRPYFLPPIIHVGTVSEGSRMGPGHWLIAQKFFDAGGHEVAVGSAHVATAEQIFQRSDRFFLFQGIETAVFLLLTLCCCVGAIVALKRIRS